MIRQEARQEKEALHTNNEHVIDIQGGNVNSCISVHGNNNEGNNSSHAYAPTLPPHDIPPMQTNSKHIQCTSPMQTLSVPSSDQINSTPATNPCPPINESALTDLPVQSPNMFTIANQTLFSPNPSPPHVKPPNQSPPSDPLATKTAQKGKGQIKSNKDKISNKNQKLNLRKKQRSKYKNSKTKSIDQDILSPLDNDDDSDEETWPESIETTSKMSTR